MASVVVSLVFTLRSAARSRAALHLEVLALRHHVGPESLAPLATSSDRGRSGSLGVAVAGVERLAAGAHPRQAGHRTRLAPTRVPPVLDVEESVPYGSSSRRSRGPRVDSSHGHRESALGCAADSWGTAEVVDRGESGDRREVHAATRQPPSQPGECSWPTRLARSWLPISSSGEGSPTGCCSCSSSSRTTGDGSSTSPSPTIPRHMDGATVPQRLSRGPGAAVPAARPRYLVHGRHVHHRRDADPRGPHGSAIAVTAPLSVSLARSDVSASIT